MTIALHDVITAFQGSLRLNLKILKEVYGSRSLELMPQQGQPLHAFDDAGQPMSVFVPLDAILGPTAILTKAWDSGKQSVLKQVIGASADEFCLIDIGANAGFFTRQCLNQIPQIKKVYCYEPNPLNFTLLGRNLSGLARVSLNHYGLSDREGLLDFHIDPDNAGNYSLNANAMPAAYSTTQVKIAQALQEQDRWLTETSMPFIYKSDTQGFDEVIASSLDLSFWSRVRLGIFELWRIPGKAYDTEKFRAVLDAFEHKVFEKNLSQQVTTADVLTYLQGEDKLFDDLYFWH